MVVIYAAQLSSRLQYITSFIFNNLLQTPFQITNDLWAFKTIDAIKICYDQSQDDVITVVPDSNLLFETTITTQHISVG